MNILIIGEKPSVATRIAEAIGDRKAERHVNKQKVSYFEIKKGSDTIFVAAAVGHLFTIKQSDKERSYPALNVEWAPSHTVGKKSDFTEKYLDILMELAKKSDKIINACDFDIEGTVIGTNIIKFANKGKIKENSQRMKFSTTTTEDLLESYSHLQPLDLNNFYAGEARHMLDWLWGINLSRALTFAVTGGSFRNSLSIGRVQGPTLAILAQREQEIAKFISKPFWRIFATVNDIEFINSKGDMFEKEVATKAFEETNKHKSNGIVHEIELREQQISPYPPFDLTSMQIEASRTLHMDPSLTLAIAQSLYEKAYISYPRTSSQKLPATLGLPKIISALAKLPEYSSIAKKLIAEKRFKPLEGAKTDDAHPAIFPTGVAPQGLTEQETRLYDFIARRFLACFAEFATVARAKVTLTFGSETYTANGSQILKKGWLDIYTYAKIDEKMLPEFKKGTKVSASSVDMKDLETQPPKRYAKAGLLSELEKRDLGTKATRAQIIDTLFRRNYIEGTSIKVTTFGMSVYETLFNYCNMIVDEQTTRKLEEDMDKISKNQLKEQIVIDEGKKMLVAALELFNKNKDQIAVELRKSLRETEILGKCPTDGGNLVVKRSRFGKQFAACANYPKCTQTYSLPQGAKIIPTGETCEHCHTPIIKVIRAGKRPFEMDLDPNCVTKKDWAFNKKKVEGETVPAATSDTPAAPPTAEVALPKEAKSKRVAKKAEPKVTAEKKKVTRKKKVKSDEA